MNTRALALWIEIVSWSFALLGLALPFASRTAAFAAWRESLATWAYGTPVVPASDENLLGLLLGITGGSIAGKWIVHALVARGPLAEGRAWARDLTLGGLAAWFVVDSAASLALGAGFNVWMINLMPLALVGVPLVVAAPRFREDAGRSPIGRAARACLLASLFGAATGIGIAFGGATPLFDLWFRGLEAAHYGGAALAEPTKRFALFFFGPIGGCTIAQFAMLAEFVRREPDRMRVAVAGAVSIAAWFAIDSGYGIAHDGLFNIALVNVPAAVVTLPPWLVLAAGLRRRR